MSKSSLDAKRGGITKFSRKSALRLRRLLARIETSGMCGITLTVPWRDWDDCVYEDYKACFNRFTLLFRRRFPRGWSVFRHELQKRKMPHTHAVCGGVDFQNTDMVAMWLRCLDRLDNVDMHGFVKYGVKVDDDIEDDICAYRYLCAHASKHKKEQLGWQGRQWGVIGGRNIRYQQGEGVRLSDSEWVYLTRTLRRLCSHTREKKGVPFGKVKRVGRTLGAVCFADKKTIERIIDYAKNHS